MTQSPQFETSEHFLSTRAGRALQTLSGISNAFEHASSPEPDFSLDDFDKQLLAEHPDEDEWRLSPAPTRLSLPTSQIVEVSNQAPLGLRAALLDTRQYISSSPSPIYSASSPIVSALRNRQRAVHRSSQTHQHSMPHTPRDKMQPTVDTPLAQQPAKSSTNGLSRTPPIIQGIQLIPTSRLSDELKSIFKFPIFNAVQSRCFPHAYEGADNIVLSAPTGSGKTVIMELAICRLLSTFKNQDFKVVYQAPTKSLCNERYRDWSSKFKTLGLRCAELTGDVEYAQLKAAQTANIILATPEKWDSVTRRWKDNAKLVDMIKLFLVDEVHILKESRGATLEAVVSRMKSIGSDMRFIALSATVPNSNDIAAWLGLNSKMPDRPSIREVFGEEFRPVKLEKHVIGFKSPPNDFILDNILTQEVPSCIERYSKRKPVMVFCATKKAAAKTAKTLATLFNARPPNNKLWNAPKYQIRVVDHDLQDLVPAGVAFHHSGLNAADRQAVEAGFLSGNINVICSTSTLAVGVNLPCYLVILQGTVCYADRGLQEYSSLEVMQMLGRAGRPQFETSACAVILTNREKASRYEKMISGQDMLESCLHLNLVEHLNAEIGVGTIQDLTSAKKWLASTFLYIRLQRNPTHYSGNGQSSLESCGRFLEVMCEKNATLLGEAKLIEPTRAGFKPTEFGDIMARYYVRFKTMKRLMSLPTRAKVSEIVGLAKNVTNRVLIYEQLHALTQAEEFEELRWRAGERVLYKHINKSNDIRFSVKVNIDSPAQKAFLIAQAQLGGLILDDEAARKHGNFLRQDTAVVFSHCNRLIRCLVDMQLYLGDAIAAKNALELGRSLAARVWDNTPMQLKQIEGIGDISARKFAAAGIGSIDELSNTEAHRIDLILGKTQPYGSNLLRKVAVFPSLRIDLKKIGEIRKTSRGAELRVRCDVGYLNKTLPSFFNWKHVYVCFLCETSYGKIVDFRRFSIKRLSNGEDILLNVIFDRPTTHINCHVMCDEIAGSHRYAELKLSVPSTWFPHDTPITIPRTALDDTKTDESRLEEFDDADLGDDDFLAAEAGLSDVEVVMGDIEEILIQEKQRPALTSTQGVKRKADTNAMPGDDNHNFKDWRSPTKLENGNWTCQHTCNEMGKSCNHQCCKEGVKKLRKRPRNVNAQNEPVASIIFKDSSALSNSKTKEKLKSNADIKEFLSKARKFKEESAEENDGTLFVPASSRERLETSPKPPKHIPKQLEIADIGSSNRLALTQSTHRNKPTTKEEGIDKSTVKKSEMSMYDNVYDIDDFDDPEFDDCDWVMTSLTTDHDTSKANRIRNNFDEVLTREQNHNSFSSKCEDVSKPDLKMREQGSIGRNAEKSTQKLCPTEPVTNSDGAPTSEVLKPEDELSKSSDDGFPGFDYSNEFDVPIIDCPVMEKLSVDDATSALPTNLIVGGRVDVEAVREPDVSRASPPLRDSERSLEVSPVEGPHTLSNLDEESEKETEEQRRKRVYEEDQKEKWKEIDPKLYEMFGDIVELI